MPRDIPIREPGRLTDDPIFVYKGVITRAGRGWAEVVLPKWPDQPIGIVFGGGGWTAELYLPPDGVNREQIGHRRTRDEAVQLVVETYHRRFAKQKYSGVWLRDREPVTHLEDVLPRRWASTVPVDHREARSQLHRFLALNRWFFDAPDVIRPYVPEPEAPHAVDGWLDGP